MSIMHPTPPDAASAAAGDEPTPSVPEGVDRKSLFEEATREAHIHKWLESEKAGRDLGDEAIADWHKRHWHAFTRERWVQHLRGEVFWNELDNNDFGFFASRFHDNRELVDRIASKIETGGENLDIIEWAVAQGTNVSEVVDVLKRLDINRRRLLSDASINVNNRDFIAGIHERHHPRALVVDGNAEDRRVLADILRTEDLEVVEADSGEEAMDIVRSRRFDLFVIDVELPGKYGAEVAWYLHRHGVRKNVIAIGATPKEWNAKDLYDCGFTGLFTKPLLPDALRELAREVRDGLARVN